MKNINKLTLLLAVPFLFACEGTGGDNTGNADDFAMFIEVNKTEIEADGKDAATFVIKDSKGNILSTETNLGYVSFKNVETEERLDRYETDFTSIDRYMVHILPEHDGRSCGSSGKRKGSSCDSCMSLSGQLLPSFRTGRPRQLPSVSFRSIRNPCRSL